MSFNALLRKLDVDPIQWRALLRVMLRMDFPIFIANKSKAERRTVNLLGTVLLIYGAAGMTPAVIAWRSPDVLLGATLLATIVGFMVASSLLMGEGSSIVSPSDHNILGFRPVTSRTYLAVRVAALLIRSLVISGCVAMLTTLVFLSKGGLHPGLAMTALLTAEMTGFATTLAIVAMYGWILRVAGPDRLTRYTAYLQLMATSTVWLGLIVVTQGLNSRFLQGLTLSATSWWIALPPAWFGSYALLAIGQGSAMVILATSLSVASVALFGWLIRDKLSMAYGEDLARVATATAGRGVVKGSSWLGGLAAETRAVAILVRSQLEHDMKFRMGLISLVPITVVYMFMGGWPRDPFMPKAHNAGSEGPFIQLALVFLPMTIRQSIVSSESYRAAWIFHTTPANRGKLVQSARNLITAFFLIPYLACLAAVFAYSYGNSTHALIHTSFLGLVSWLVLQLTIMMSPQLPFSMPPGKDAEVGMAFVRMLASMFIGMASYFTLVYYVYRQPARMAIAAGILLAGGFMLDWAARKRAMRRPIEAMLFD